MQRASVGLDRLRVFVAVTEAGGFSAAAARLGVSKALVSQQIARLEGELGTALFTRTTRRVTLTEAGRQLHGECKPLLHELEGALGRVGGSATELQGTLRFTAPLDDLTLTLASVLADFVRRHPALRLEVVATDEVLDLVAEGIDVAIRIGFLRDSSLRAVALGKFEQYVVAAPAYLARHGTPEHPRDLTTHRWIMLTRLRAPLTWTFTRGNAGRCTVRVQPALSGNAPAVVHALARAGAGITTLASVAVAQDLAEGTLVRVLPDWSLPCGGIYAVYPAARMVSAKTRAMVDFLRSHAALIRGERRSAATAPRGR